jgi:hypothetical protein
MINLLPTELNSSVTYARRNRTLVRWLVALGVGFAGIVALVVIGLFYIDYQVNAYQKQVTETKEQLAKEELEATQARVDQISSSVKLANQVLSREILFSRLLRETGSVIPPGTALQNLNITNDLQGGIDLQFAAVDYQTGTQVQVNLTDPRNGVFEKADIQNISCTEGDEQTTEANSEYPCQVTIRALFKKDSPFTFTGNGANNE